MARTTIRQILACALFSTLVAFTVPTKADAKEYLVVCANSIAEAKEIAWRTTNRVWSVESRGDYCGHENGYSTYRYYLSR